MFIQILLDQNHPEKMFENNFILTNQKGNELNWDYIKHTEKCLNIVGSSSLTAVYSKSEKFISSWN